MVEDINEKVFFYLMICLSDGFDQVVIKILAFGQVHQCSFRDYIFQCLENSLENCGILWIIAAAENAM